MSMNCCWKKKYHYCHSLEQEDVTLVKGVSATIITAPDNYVNKDIYKYRYCMNFAETTGVEILQINNGTDTYPVWDSNGVPVKIGRLRRCTYYDLVFVSVKPAHFVIKDCLSCLWLKPTASSE